MHRRKPIQRARVVASENNEHSLHPALGAGGEAALRGHLRGQGNEQGGSQSYVPRDPKDDKALQRAIELLHASR